MIHKESHMNQSKSRYKRYASFGPGGIKCGCCGPAPKHKKAALRLAKRQERRLLFKDLIQDQLDD